MRLSLILREFASFSLGVVVNEDGSGRGLCGSNERSWDRGRRAMEGSSDGAETMGNGIEDGGTNANTVTAGYKHGHLKRRDGG